VKVEKSKVEEKQQPTAQGMLDGAQLQKVLATWTMTVVHPDTFRAGADSFKGCRRPHWTTAKGYTLEMGVKWYLDVTQNQRN
jgi:hypothetical protein